MDREKERESRAEVVAAWVGVNGFRGRVPACYTVRFRALSVKNGRKAAAFVERVREKGRKRERDLAEHAKRISFAVTSSVEFKWSLVEGKERCEGKRRASGFSVRNNETRSIRDSRCIVNSLRKRHVVVNVLFLAFC